MKHTKNLSQQFKKKQSMTMCVVLCAVFFSLLNGCNSDEQEPASPSGEQEPASSNDVLNITVILDTSNRVSPERRPDQIQRDTKIVEEIVVQFVKVAKKHIGQSSLKYDGSLTVVAPNQPSVASIPWGIMEKLTIPDPNDWNSIQDMEESLEQQKEALLEGISQLYEFVLEHPQTGSDIYRWFQYKRERDFDKKRRNLIICLSDGYLNFDRNIEAKRLPGTYMRTRELRDDPDWRQKILDGEGLKPIGKDFSRYNVKFLMLEITPQRDGQGIPYPQDFEIIKVYWDTWLKSMGIKGDFIEHGAPPINEIKSFISVESK